MRIDNQCPLFSELYVIQSNDVIKLYIAIDFEITSTDSISYEITECLLLQ